MKYIITLLIIVTAQGVSIGQNLQSDKISHKDSVLLDQFWKKFKKAILSRDTHTIQLLSLKTVDCDLFQSDETLTQSSFLPLNTFLNQFYQHWPNSKLKSAMTTKKHYMMLTEKDFKPPNIKHQKKNYLIIYEIAYVTWEPNELQKGHEGETRQFDFVKIDGNFKFYGMSSIP